MSATDTSAELERWLAPLLWSLPALTVVDAHTHLGIDYDGAAASEALEAAPGSILQGLAGVAVAATLVATPDVEIE